MNTILNQPYRHRVSVGRLIATKAIWLHLSMVSPALHPPEIPSHTHTPKHRFRREMRMSCVVFWFLCVSYVDIDVMVIYGFFVCL